MKTNLTRAIGGAAICCSILTAQFAAARGFGGAHGEAGGSYSGSHEGSYSGSHYSGSHEGSYSNGSYSGSHEGSYSGAHYSGSHEGSTSDGSYSGSREGTASGANYSGSHEGSVSGTTVGGYHAGSVEASGYHAGSTEAGGYHAEGYAAAGHVGLPTDAGFGAAGAAVAHPGAAGYAAGHQTEAVSAGTMAARGAAVRNSYTGAGTFDHGWYGAHPGAWAATGWTAGRAWDAVGWGGVGVALGWGTVEPITYAYGNNITYQGDQVYYGDQPVASADQYYQQAAAIAQAPPAADPQATDWTPLGVFALVHEAEDTPHYVIQLAVNKSGALRGNYVDLVSGSVMSIQGGVDKKTQRVAWTVGDNKTNVGETGLYSLTQSEGAALIHNGKDKTQQWLLVRLKQPE